MYRRNLEEENKEKARRNSINKREETDDEDSDKKETNVQPVKDLKKESNTLKNLSVKLKETLFRSSDNNLRDLKSESEPKITGKMLPIKETTEKSKTPSSDDSTEQSPVEETEALNSEADAVNADPEKIAEDEFASAFDFESAETLSAVSRNSKDANKFTEDVFEEIPSEDVDTFSKPSDKDVEVDIAGEEPEGNTEEDAIHDDNSSIKKSEISSASSVRPKSKTGLINSASSLTKRNQKEKPSDNSLFLDNEFVIKEEPKDKNQEEEIDGMLDDVKDTSSVKSKSADTLSDSSEKSIGQPDQTIEKPDINKTKNIFEEVEKKPFSAFEELFPKSRTPSRDGESKIFNEKDSLDRNLGSAETLRLSKFPSASSSVVGSASASKRISGSKRRPTNLAEAIKDSFFDEAAQNIEEEGTVKKRKTRSSDSKQDLLGDKIALAGNFDEIIDDSTPLLQSRPSEEGLESLPPFLKSSLPDNKKTKGKKLLSPRNLAPPSNRTPLTSPRSRSKNKSPSRRRDLSPSVKSRDPSKERGRGRGKKKAPLLDKKPGTDNRSQSRRRGKSTTNLLDPKLNAADGRRSREASRSRDASPAKRKTKGKMLDSSSRSRSSLFSGLSRAGRGGGAGGGDGDNNDDDKDKEPEAPVILDEEILAEIERQKARIMPLCMKGDWPAIDHALKVLEQARVPSSRYEPYHPLKGMFDETSGYSPLLFSARDNRTHFIDRLIELGCDANAKTKDGWASVHLAAMYSREEAIRALVHKKADINATGGPFEQSLLHLACERALPQRPKHHLVPRPVVTATTARGRPGTRHDPKEQNVAHLVAGRSIGAAVALMKVILMYGKPELRLVKDNKGDLPLFTAIEAGNSGLVKELLFHNAREQVRDARAKTKDTALHIACLSKDTDMVRILVDAGSIVDARNNAGKTPLHIVAEVGDENTAKYFYNIHVNPNIIDNQDRTALHIAAENGNTAIVDLLAEKFRASVMERTKDGSTLAHIASLHGHPETVMSFLKKGVPLHMPNKDGARCLHTAAQAGHIGVVNTILNKGEHIDCPTNLGFTALHIAVRANKPAMVETLLGWGASLKVQGGPALESALHLAARVKDGEKCAEMLLKSGADPNLQKNDGQTPLMLAAQHGNSRVMKLLIEYGADPVVRSKNGETALHLACISCRVDVAKALLEYTIRKSGREAVTDVVDTPNLEGETPLHYVARIKPGTSSKKADPKEMAALLLSNGNNLAAKTIQTSETPFHYVAVSGNEEVLSEMLAHSPPSKIQALVNAPSKKGFSALLSAADQGHVGIVKMLLDNNARVDVFDTEGKAALHLAAAKGFTPVCEALLSHKAFVNARNVAGLTALHLASMEGYNDLVKNLIVKHSAQKDSLSLKKETPLHLAAESGQFEVCETLLQLGADGSATTDEGKKAVHLAAMHNHSEVVQLFINKFPEDVSTADKEGNTCAHIAALKGSVGVVRELMKHNPAIVTGGRNRVGDNTPLHLAAEGGNAELVEFLVTHGASATLENGDGLTATHLAARYGHLEVLNSLRFSHQDLGIFSRKLGMTALHIAAHYGQTEILRELLSYIPATVKSVPPAAKGGKPFIPELGTESDLTALHLAAHQGNENVVRVLFNSAGVSADVKSKINGYIPLHMACMHGHTNVVGLLLSKSAKQVHIADKKGRTGLHIASTNGHYDMVNLLMGQGVDLEAKDREGWTSLHYASKMGHIKVVKLLTEAGAKTMDKTNEGKIPICYAAAYDHVEVFSYLIEKDHDSYELLDDHKFIHDLTVMSRKYAHEPLREYVLLSPAPVDIAHKLAHSLLKISEKEKESQKDLIEASKYSEQLATQLVAIASASFNPGVLLRAIDSRGIALLDSLIEHEQKIVIAHPSVQRYLNDVWMGSLNWPSWKMAMVFMIIMMFPPFWIILSFPASHKYYQIPFTKFLAYLVSHCYMLLLMILMVVIPLNPIWELTNLWPRWYDWLLLAWFSGNLVSELTSPGDRAGLGWIKVFVLMFGGTGVLTHVIGFLYLGQIEALQEILYIRNVLIGFGLLIGTVQLLDFLSFHNLFGPWAVIISKLMVDLGRFLVILAIFMFGFTMYVSAIYNPIRPIYVGRNSTQIVGSGYPPAEAPVQSPISTAEMLFYSLFGLVEPDYMPPFYSHPVWAKTLMKIIFGIYQMVTVIVLINLLIAMMSDTYQRIHAKSDIEWKYGLAKLIRNYSRISGTPSPLNLFLKFTVSIVACFKYKGNLCSDGALEYIRKEGRLESAKHKKGDRRMSKNIAKSRSSIAPRSTDNLIAATSSAVELGGGASNGEDEPKPIATCIDWKHVVKKFRIKTEKDKLTARNAMAGGAAIKIGEVPDEGRKKKYTEDS